MLVREKRFGSVLLLVVDSRERPLKNMLAMAKERRVLVSRPPEWDPIGVPLSSSMSSELNRPGSGASRGAGSDQFYYLSSVLESVSRKICW